MLGYIKDQLRLFGIEVAECIPLSLCNIDRPYKLERAGFSLSEELYAVIFAIPYYTEHEKKNISSYAVACDYHLFCEMLFSKLIPILKERFPNNLFAGFSDNSPIDERRAAAMSGIGIIGQNQMLITERYSSYVFLAEIITDLPLEQNNDYHIEYCDMCGRCLSACPMGDKDECLSALTQKKGELDENECKKIKKYGSAWGCDICQEVCPYTERAMKNKTIYTDIEFFKNDLLPILSAELVNEMPDHSFSRRAYAWRKKETIMRNLHILEDINEG